MIRTNVDLTDVQLRDDVALVALTVPGLPEIGVTARNAARSMVNKQWSVYGVLMALAISTTAMGQESDEAKKDLDRMQGSWRVVSSQMAEEKASKEDVEKRKVTVKRNALIYETGNERNEKREGTIKLDPKTQAFDWTVTFPEGDGTMLAIYELKGDDLKIGFGNDGLIRPKRFEIDRENVVWLLVLKRQNP